MIVINSSCFTKFLKQLLVKGTQCSFENLPLSPSSYENNMLKISH